MSQVQVAGFNFQDFIMLAGNKLVTDSQKVAKAFGKRHADVLRAIKKMRDSKNNEIVDHYQRNFALIQIDADLGLGRTRKDPAYEMTRDGFAELAMSFTGELARVIRIRFIAAFNAMADFIRNSQMSIWKQMQDWTARNESSSVRASFGSHLMLDRKKQLPELKSEYAALTSKIQPDMFAIQ